MRKTIMMFTFLIALLFMIFASDLFSAEYLPLFEDDPETAGYEIETQYKKVTHEKKITKKTRTNKIR